LGQKVASEWEVYLPRVAFILNCTARKSLGGRTPFEVVTGLTVQLPNHCVTGLWPAAITADKYARDLVHSLSEVYAAVHRVQLSDLEKREDGASKGVGGVFTEGELVLVRLPPDLLSEISKKKSEEEGLKDDFKGKKYISKRLLSKCYPGLYRVASKISDHAYNVADATEPERKLSFKNPINVTRLVRIQEVRMSDFAIEGERVIEVLSQLDADTWTKARVIEMGADGRVLLHWQDSGTKEFVDLTSRRYRWIQ